MTTRYDNAPELGALSLVEHDAVEAARGAFTALKKTFDHWVTILTALQMLERKAERLLGRKTFQRLREQTGLGEQVISKATVTRGLQIMERLPEVMEWRQTLSDKQQYEWASPSAIFRHCPLFTKPADRKREMSPVEKARQANVRLQEENHTLKQREDGDRFKATDTADDIATVIVGMVSPRKAKEIARHVLEKLQCRATARPQRPTETASQRGAR